MFKLAENSTDNCVEQEAFDPGGWAEAMQCNAIIVKQIDSRKLRSSRCCLLYDPWFKRIWANLYYLADMKNVQFRKGTLDGDFEIIEYQWPLGGVYSLAAEGSNSSRLVVEILPTTGPVAQW